MSNKKKSKEEKEKKKEELNEILVLNRDTKDKSGKLFKKFKKLKECLDTIDKSDKMIPTCLKALEEFLPLLKLRKFEHAKTDLYTCTFELLSLWNSLLRAAAKKWSSNFLTAMIFISRREEIVELKDAKEPQKLFVLCKIYRVLLYDTNLVVENLLALHLKKNKGKFSSPPVVVVDLCALSMSISFERISGFSELIIEKMLSYIHRKVREKLETKKFESKVIPDKISKFSVGWEPFNNRVVEYCTKSKVESEKQQLKFSSRLEPQFKNWSDILNITNDFPYMFIGSYISHLQYVMEAKDLCGMKDEWNGFKNFYIFKKFFLYGLNNTKEVPRSMLLCSMSLLKCDPHLINSFVKKAFSKTRTTSLGEIYNLLDLLKNWFKFFTDNKMKLPTEKFDTEFFVEGLKLMLELEHTSITVKILALLYDNYECFCLMNRKKIYHDFLVVQMFDYFILNWSDSVRSTFVQLLIFRMQNNGDLQKKINKTQNNRLSVSTKKSHSDPNTYNKTDNPNRHSKGEQEINSEVPFWELSKSMQDNIDEKIDSEVKLRMQKIKEQLIHKKKYSPYSNVLKKKESKAPRTSKDDSQISTPRVMETKEVSTKLKEKKNSTNKTPKRSSEKLPPISENSPLNEEKFPLNNEKQSNEEKTSDNTVEKTSDNTVEKTSDNTVEKPSDNKEKTSDNTEVPSLNKSRSFFSKNSHAPPPFIKAHSVVDVNNCNFQANSYGGFKMQSGFEKTIFQKEYKDHFPEKYENYAASTYFFWEKYVDTCFQLLAEQFNNKDFVFPPPIKIIKTKLQEGQDKFQT